MISVDIISKIVSKGTGKAPSAVGGESNFDLSDYLLKEIWEKVFEIKTDAAGNEYIFGKLPVVTKYGITMYGDDGSLNLPSIYAGLPIDGVTLYWDNGVLKAKGGGEGGGEADSIAWANVYGKPSWITDSKPIYNYNEIKNTPDLSVFVTGTAFSNTLADYATLTYLTSELEKYVTIKDDQDIVGVKNFLNGLKIGGIPITKKQNDVIYLDANLVVRGGITMYAENEVDIPSILDSLPIASNTALGIATFDSTYFSVDASGKVTLINAPSSVTTLGSLLNVDSSVDSTANADMVLFKAANSATWVYKNVNDIINSGGASGATGDVLSARFGSYSANSIYDFYYTGVQKGGGLPSTSQYGSLLTLPYRKAFGNTIPDFAAQIFIPNGDDSSPYLFFRTSIGTSWNEWKRVVSLNSKGIVDTPIKVHNDSFIVESRNVNSYISYNGINSSVYFGDIGFHRDSGLASIWTEKTGWRPIIYGADYNGNLVVSGGITMYSDQRKKTILNHVELSLKQIADAPLIQHYYNSDQDKNTHVGSIAQYWASINDWFCKLDNEGFYTMEIQNCALASAISIARHLEKYESKTDKTIRKMKKRIQELEVEVERLKQN